MSERKSGGSRYLYEPFDYAPAHKLEANERVMEERWKALEYRLGQIEVTLERLEKRMWMTIFGVSAAILSETVTGFLVP
jgi:hypothetical protein